MIIVTDTPNGFVVEFVGTDGRPYPYDRSRKPNEAAVQRVLAHCPNDIVRRCRCAEDREEALAEWHPGIDKASRDAAARMRDENPDQM